MKKLDWKGVGIFIATFGHLVTAIVAVFKKSGIGLEILDWLIGEGKEKLEEACRDLVSAYKHSKEYKSQQESQVTFHVFPHSHARH